MTFIGIKDGKLFVDFSELNDCCLEEGLRYLLDKGGFDKRNISTGVPASPDVGYFSLADRFWRASLCIYFAGVSRRFFYESCEGYGEPWLFNACHSIELFLKGFLSYTIWFKELQDNHLSLGDRKQIKKLSKEHELIVLYRGYKDKLQNLLSTWNTEKLSEPPTLDKLLLSTRSEEVLKEISKSNKNGFRFRYPTLKQTSKNQLQEQRYQHDASHLFPLSGMPKEAGYFFDHMKVINNLLTLRKEIDSIRTYLGGCWDFISESQYIELEEMRYYKEYFTDN